MNLKFKITHQAKLKNFKIGVSPLSPYALKLKMDLKFEFSDLENLHNDMRQAKIGYMVVAGSQLRKVGKYTELLKTTVLTKNLVLYKNFFS